MEDGVFYIYVDEFGDFQAAWSKPEFADYVRVEYEGERPTLLDKEDEEVGVE